MGRLNPFSVTRRHITFLGSGSSGVSDDHFGGRRMKLWQLFVAVVFAVGAVVGVLVSGVTGRD